MGDPTSSPAQQALAERVRCYRERIVRRLVVKHQADAKREDWMIEAGWTEADRARYAPPPPVLGMFAVSTPPQYLSGLTFSTCDVLKYKTPEVVPCDKLQDHPVFPSNKDDSSHHALARIALAAAEPTRQHELFGWSRPANAEPEELALFEWIKGLYWDTVCRSSLKHLELLKDTADFHANDLLRLLYLTGELPPQLVESDMPGRVDGDLHRNDNSCERIQQRIQDALLEFKYWVDDPFYMTQEEYFPIFGLPVPVTEPFYPGDAEAIKAAREEARKDGDYGDKPDQDMTYWSENHQLLFATAEYLAGQWLPDQVFRAGLRYRTDKDATRPGDKTGEERMLHAKPRLLDWLEQRLRFGFSEWNAPGYYTEDIKPLLNLADFCLDDEIRVRAQMVLDLIIFDLARFNLNGNFGVTAGRCYFNQKTCSYDQPVGDFVTLVFGTRDGVYVWDGDETASAFASSRGYSVPDVLLRMALDRPQRVVDRTRVSINLEEASIYGVGLESLTDAMFWWGRSAYFSIPVLQCSSAIATRYRLLSTPPFNNLAKAIKALDTSTSFPGTFAFSPGEAKALAEGPSLTRANLYTYKTANTMLSSVQNFHAGQMGAQVQACQATIGPGAVVWTSHLSAGGFVDPTSTILGVTGIPFGPAGAFIGYGVAVMTGDAAPQEVIPADFSDGPNWWTGSATLPRVVQHEGAAILAYNPKDLEDIFGAKTHAWFPKPAFGDSVTQRLSSNCNADDGNWTFGKVDDAYVALFSAREVTWTTDGPWADRELMAESGRNIYIIQVGNAAEFGTYDAFIEKVSGARVHINGLHWGGSDFECSYDIPTADGGRLELHDDGHQAFYNRARQFDDHFPRFETPYVNCGRVRWGQYHYTITFDGDTLTHDFRELRTKSEGAAVHRITNGTADYDCEQDRIWVASNRGARHLFPENTIEACRHAIVDERAMAVLVDACLTADGEVVLWRDWSPDDFSATLRQIGIGDLGAYRPAVPASGDPQRRDTIELTLAALRFGYGYERVEAPLAGADPAPFVIPTLDELLAAAREWRALRHLLIDVRLPAHAAAEHAGAMMDRIAAAVAGADPLDVTLLIDDEDVLAAMQAALPTDDWGRANVKLSWVGDVPDFPSNDDGTPDVRAREEAIRTNTPVETAIRLRTAVATLRHSLADGKTSFEDYNAFVAHDVARLEPYNLNPRENQGHQVERLLTTVRNDVEEMRLLLAIGVSGIITDDVTALRRVVSDAGLA